MTFKTKIFTLILGILFYPTVSLSADIWESAKNGDLEQVKKFIDVDKVDVNVKNKDDRTPLHYASEYGNLEVVIYLVQKGANVDAKDKNGRTPLHLASVTPVKEKPYQEYFYVVFYLVKDKEKQGLPQADVNAKDNDNMTPLDHANETEVYQAQKRLKDLEYSPGPLDGIWGNKTGAAIRKFQQDNRLQITGKLDNETKSWLGLITVYLKGAMGEGTVVPAAIYAWIALREGNSYYWRFEDYDSAIKSFTEAIGYDETGNCGSGTDGIAYMLRGAAYFQEGVNDKAIDDFSKAISINPKEGLFYYNRGNAYEKTGMCKLAIEDFKKAIAIALGGIKDPNEELPNYLPLAMRGIEKCEAKMGN